MHSKKNHQVIAKKNVYVSNAYIENSLTRTPPTNKQKTDLHGSFAICSRVDFPFEY